MGVWTNIKLLADEFASHGYTCMVPDIFNGDALTLNDLVSQDIPKWVSEGSNGENPHTPEAIDPIVSAAIETLRADFEAGRVGSVGYCFGAKYTVRHLKSGIDVGYVAHPSFVAEEELGAIAGPLSIAAAEHDTIFTVEDRHRSEPILSKTGQPFQISLYSNVAHGFAVRGDMKNEDQRLSKEQVFEQAITLTVEESAVARDVIRSLHPDTVLVFRQIYLYEPPKAQVVEFLELEHSGKLTDTTPRPPRLAQVWFDVGAREKTPEYVESIVDIGLNTVVSTQTTGPRQLSALIMDEIREVVAACDRSELFQDKLRQFQLPAGFEAIVEPWPYGASDPDDDGTRFFQGLVYAVNKETGGYDSNFYAYPIPLIPVMDAKTREIVRVLDVATGGKDDPFQSKTCGPNVIDHCQAAEYLPEKLPQGVRKDLKPLTVVQPEGASFSIVGGNRIEWQKWSMRLTFNPREGAVLHDIRYDGRSVLYRLSMSDMPVPYADPRSPFHRKQAFDFGDGGLGHAVNNLSLGCDCLGLIKYFDGLVTDPTGDVQETKNLICLHEQDNGIGWKHTDWRTGRAAVTRRRELVVQYIITLANYEYVFNFKFDEAAGITIETRATGIVSVVNINPGQTAPWGNVVSPGALAQNHQHIFIARIDPAIDGQANTVVQEESLPVPMNPETNPHGNYYEVRQTVLKASAGVDLAPQNNRVFKVQNRAKTNPISGKPIGYQVVIPPTQLLLADPESIQSKRAAFAHHHLWVTKYKEDELYAGGRYTLQSKVEAEGVADAAARADNVEDEDLVLWTVFGLTHNPRVEDWPVMPVETLQVHLVPSDFFSQNPAIDVPPSKDQGSKIWTATCAC